MAESSGQAGRLGLADDLAARAAAITVGELLAIQAGLRPDDVAVVDDVGSLTYAAFNARVNRLVRVLSGLGVSRGDRVGILSENRSEYLEALFAAAKLGAISATLNWRLKATELAAAVGVTSPGIILVSRRYADVLGRIPHGAERVVAFGPDYEERLAAEDPAEPEVAAEPEDGLVIIYTSGTTGVPKGALISHRAEIARMQIHGASYGMTREDACVAWTPLFHVASIDPSFSLLCQGGKVIAVDGFQLEQLLEIIQRERIWWLVLIPGMLDRLIEGLKRRPIKPKRIKLIGAQADLLPRHQIA